MSKQRRWYGRPNPPPLGWDGKPVIRKVAGDVYGSHSETANERPTGTEDTSLISVSLRNSHWIRMLRMLTAFGRAHGDEAWQEWRKGVREVVIYATNQNTSDSQPTVVALSIDDWRTLYGCVKQACDEGPSDEWRRWFIWLSKTVSEQIRGQTGGA